ncbi:MAG TPA: hypothetical protein VHZ25_12050 [Acidobacteriaceae bacterium]|nr:hypothetical protein [Acidobacteriaceae bacterium]
MRQRGQRWGCGLALVAGLAGAAWAQGAKTAYPDMAPVEQYMMERGAEIALARTAAPMSIAKDAAVMVLGRHGYETAVAGKNGFVCLVFRSWTAGTDDADYWNPKAHSPICLNAAAARSYLPLMTKRTELVLAGRTTPEVIAEIKSDLDTGKLPKLEPGAMCFMMSKQGVLNNAGGPWHPHLMFFEPLQPAAWGADLEGSPVLSAEDALDRLTIFMVPVRQWSDGTADAVAGH